MWQVRSYAFSEGEHCCREISVIAGKLQESSGGNPCCITEHDNYDVL